MVVVEGNEMPQLVTWSTSPLSDSDGTTLATGPDHSVSEGTV